MVGWVMVRFSNFLYEELWGFGGENVWFVKTKPNLYLMIF